MTRTHKTASPKLREKTSHKFLPHQAVCHAITRVAYCSNVLTDAIQCLISRGHSCFSTMPRLSRFVLFSAAEITYNTNTDAQCCSLVMPSIGLAFYPSSHLHAMRGHVSFTTGATCGFGVKCDHSTFAHASMRAGKQASRQRRRIARSHFRRGLIEPGCILQGYTRISHLQSNLQLS